MTEHEPAYEIVDCPAQPYAAIALTTSMDRMGRDAPPLNDEVFGWLAAHGGHPAGPPFWRYDRIQMPGRLDLQVGVTVDAPIEGDDRVVGGELPAGRYLEVLHVGHPDSLERATGDLLAYADEAGLTFDVDGDLWAARIEYYLTDPDDEPDLSLWQTVLSFKLAG